MTRQSISQGGSSLLIKIEMIYIELRKVSQPQTVKMVVDVIVDDHFPSTPDFGYRFTLSQGRSIDWNFFPLFQDS